MLTTQQILSTSGKTALLAAAGDGKNLYGGSMVAFSWIL